MTAPLAVHVTAGMLALCAGVAALATRKGRMPHRRSGLVFLGAMVVMALTGSAIAFSRLPHAKPSSALHATSLMGIFATYLVVTAFTAVRPPDRVTRVLNAAGIVVALLVAAGQLALAARVFLHIDDPQAIQLTVVELVVGAIALLAAVSDLRIIRSARLEIRQRLVRHAWRMSMALWFAGFAFLPRLVKYMPKPYGPLVVAVPLLSLLVTLAYWLWRIQRQRQFSLPNFRGWEFHSPGGLDR